MRNVIHGSIILLLGGLAIGAGDSPAEPKPIHSISARTAIEKEAHAEETAKRECRKAIVKAEQQEITELQASQRNALAQKDSDDAALIGQVIQGLESDLRGSYSVAVDAKKTWQDGPTLPAGTYIVSAEGKWSDNVDTKHWVDANGDPKKHGAARLLTKVGDEILTDSYPAEFTIKEPTKIYFQIDDKLNHDDNGGTLSVIIRQN
jgi:hypothetical protein